MGNIVLLDDLTINKIAAGEVIERPASVIKEMVENSIDAGATNIIVEIKNGGISYIRVSDNGKGIAQDDMEIAFERHATSKIRSADDLDKITSMGFRGEALASVAAIANVEMISKTKDQEIGYKVVVEGGEILESEETACRNGTIITVKNLFFNTPVRYKFLKKDYTESGYIEDVLTRIALVNPNIAIKFINNGKTVIQTNGNGDIKSVIYSIYGKDIANAIMEVSYNYKDITITGVIGKPEIARSNRSNQLFFVNKRYIKDKTLTAATEQAYKGLIPIGKFGFVVLNLQMNPSKVDVNVHPAKLEVRFQEENEVFQSIYHAIKETLLKGELVADTEKHSLEDIVRLDKNSTTFEERLKNLKEKKNNPNNSNGLFGFRKHAGKQIEKYTDEESKIKTNIIGDIYKDGKNIETLKDLRYDEKPDENKIDGVNEEKMEYKLNSNIEKEMLEEIKQGEIGQATKKMEDILEDKVQKSFENDDDIEKNISNSENIKDTNENKLEEKSLELNNNEVKDNEIDDENTKVIELKNIPVSETIEKDSKNEQEEKSQDLNEDKKDLKNSDKNEETVEVNAYVDEDEQPIAIKEMKQQSQQNQQNQQNKRNQQKLKGFDEMYEKLFGKAPQSKIDEELKSAIKSSAVDIVKDNLSIFEEEKELQKPAYKFIGIVFNTYIILEIDNEMYILDQHAAHERIMYEKVKKNYYSGDNKDSQMLLLPDVITLTHKEMDIAKENKEMFEQAGFTLEEFGENTIKLTGVPNICIDLNTRELFLETLDEINTVARTAKQEKEEKFIATVACKAAVKANMALTVEEVDSLMDKLLSLPNPFTCPHGRPTAIKMTKYDIERKFARK